MHKMKSFLTPIYKTQGMQIFLRIFRPKRINRTCYTIAATHLGDADFQVGLGVGGLALLPEAFHTTRNTCL